MKHLQIISAIKLLVVALAVAVGSTAAWADDDAGFSTRDISGPYGFSLDGFIIDPAAGLVPAGAVGQFEADGAGRFPNVVRTLNVGGAAGTQLFVGNYTVNPDGTGFACFCGSAPQAIPGIPPLSIGPTFETFSFVITSDDGSEAEFVGIGLRFVTGMCPFDLGVSCPPTVADQPILDANLTPVGSSLQMVTGRVRSQADGSGDDD